MGEQGVDVVLGQVLALLEPRSYLRAAAVCRGWHAIAKEPQVRKAAFMHHWGLLAVRGEPRQSGFYEAASLSSFVQPHQVQRTDSLQMLAIRHRLDVATLRRVNNLMTDHSLHSRTHIFVPVADRSQLRERSVGFTFCPLAKRELAVLLGPQQQHEHLQQPPRDGSSSEPLPLPHQGQAGPEQASSSTFKIDALQAKLCALVGRSLHVDEQTAKFYLQDCGGDIKAAMEAYAQDVAWEGSTPGIIRKAPVQRWIRGEVGI